MLLPGYNVDKAAQVVAFFALKEGGAINVLKLSKLVYLAERESMRLYDEPMFYDQLASMPDGPVASVTLNFMNGVNDDERWSAFVGRRRNYNIPVANSNVKPELLDHLSRADISILEGLWQRFGSYGRYELRDWTHKSENIPEWVDPQGSSNPIPHLNVFRSLEKADSEELNKDVERYREFKKSERNCL